METAATEVRSIYLGLDEGAGAEVVHTGLDTMEWMPWARGSDAFSLLPRLYVPIGRVEFRARLRLAPERTDIIATPVSAVRGTTQDAEAMPRALSENWSRLAISKLSSWGFERLLRLAAKEDGWRGPGSKALMSEPVRAFLDFWIEMRDHASEPDLALTARGTLLAEWYRNSQRHLDIEFVSRKKLLFGLFDGQSVYEGIDSLRAVVLWLANHQSKPLRWQAR